MASWTREPYTHVLARGELVSLQSTGKACRIVCVTGSLWVTSSGHATDTVLAAGEEVTVRGRGRIVVEALRTATLRLEIRKEERTKQRVLSPQPAH
jgi:hypothetical protein